MSERRRRLPEWQREDQAQCRLLAGAARHSTGDHFAAGLVGVLEGSGTSTAISDSWVIGLRGVLGRDTAREQAGKSHPMIAVASAIVQEKEVESGAGALTPRTVPRMT